jgi:hypothetical protein
VKQTEEVKSEEVKQQEVKPTEEPKEDHPVQTEDKKTFSWKDFFLNGFDPKEADELSKLFNANALTEQEIGDIDHDLLKSMDISVAKTRIVIMKLKAQYLNNAQ